MSSHVSVIFKSGRFRCCSFPLYFCNGFLISSLNLCDEKKTDHGFVHGFYYFDEI